MEPIDLNQVRTVPLKERANKVGLRNLARPPRKGQSFSGFLDSLPGILAGADLRAVVEAVVAAHKAGRPVVVGLGQRSCHQVRS